MATKPKAILSTHDGREATVITKASNVLFEDGQTAQDILNDRQDTMITPIITTSTSMSKVGQGDSVDYSENVVDGAYESCVLKGNTKVNLIQEPSSKDVVLPYEFAEGQSVTINDTKESGAVGVELKGQTLVNIHNATTYTLSCSSSGWYDNYVSAKNEVSFTITDTAFTGWRYINLGTLNLAMLKPSTKYLVVFSEAKNITTVRFLNENGSKLLTNEVTVTNGKAIITTNANMELDKQVLYVLFPMQLGEVVVKNAMILEYVEGMENWDIPYFEGMASCKMPILTTVGKNLLPNPKQAKNGTVNGSSYSVTSDGTFTITGTATGSGGRLSLGTHDVFKLQEGVTYVFAMEKVGGDDSAPQPFFHLSSRVDNISRVAVANSSKTFTYSSKWGGLILGYNVSTGEIYNGTYRLSIVGENENRTYEPHKSTTLTTPEEIILRGIGNVKDTLNTVTGEYTQRIGEVVLDGSEEWTAYNDIFTNTIQYRTAKYTNRKIGAINIINDRFPVINAVSVDNVEAVFGGQTSVNIYVKVLRSKITSTFEEYLSQNPITVQYVLDTPITKTIPLTFTNQDNAPTTKLSTYNTTTHINASSQEGSLIPTLSHVNPSYPVILKPSTKYSIVADSYSNGHTNSPINLNLGGATASTTVGNRVTTITTPSTLSNELLTMSGRGNKLNNVMVIEGDVVGDEPYFEGMCDSKSPILLNVGKNLFDQSQDIIKPSNPSSTNTYFYDKLTNTSEVSSTNWSGFYKHPIKTVVGETYYCYSEVTWGAHISIGTHENVISGSDNNNDSIYQPRMGSFVAISDVTYVTYGFRATNRKGYVRNVMVSRSPISKYEPYKSNILSANGDKIELTEDMLEQGGFSAGGMELPTYEQCKTSTNNTIRMRSKELIKVSPNTTYIVVNKTLNLNYTTYAFNSSKRFTGEVSTTNALSFTTSPSCQYIAIMFSKGNNSTVVTSDFKESEFQIYEVDKTIVLRSLPSGVCDTLNVETGEYVQRIGELVLDGSEQGWILGTSANWYADGDTFGFYFNNFKLAQGTSLCIDKFLSIPNIHSNDMEGCYINTEWSWVGVRIYKAKLPSLTVDAFKQWLSQNHITIQYRLATPIVKTVDLSGFPFSYENGHVILSSGSIEQSLTPKVEYSVATNRNGQIRSNQKMVERHQKQLDQLQAIILANLVNSQYNQTLTTLKYELSRV